LLHHFFQQQDYHCLKSNLFELHHLMEQFQWPIVRLSNLFYKHITSIIKNKIIIRKSNNPKAIIFNHDYIKQWPKLLVNAIKNFF